MLYRRFFLATFLWICLALLTFPITAQHGGGGFKKIFDGQSLAGWQGDTSHWRVDNGSILGEVKEGKPITANTFLIWQGGKPGDFDFKAEFRISNVGNSGVNYRSEMVNNVPFGLKGYQADIDGENVYTGQNYEERGRGFLAKRGEKAVLEKSKSPQITPLANGDSLKTLIKSNDWNTIEIVAKGNHLMHYINGALMSEVTDLDDVKRKFQGLLGLQLHAGMLMRVEYRNIYIRQP